MAGKPLTEAQMIALKALARANRGIYSSDFRCIDSVKIYAPSVSLVSLRASFKVLVHRRLVEWDTPPYDPWYRITGAGLEALEAKDVAAK